MSPAGYTEDALVEQPAIALLAELGWEPFNAYQEFDHGASTLGRETKAEVILKSRLRLALLSSTRRPRPRPSTGPLRNLPVTAHG